MRIKRALTIGALLLVSASVTACDGDDDKSKASEKASAEAGNKEGGGKTSGGEASGGLPSASDMASIEYFLNQHAACLDLQTGKEYDASTQAERYSAWLEEDQSTDPVWAIKDRAVCMDQYDHPNTLLLISDMKQFQTTMKDKGYSGILIGKDFAVYPQDDQTALALRTSGLNYLACDPEFKVPSGYEQKPAQVDGCVVTTYIPTDV
ncbi:hypothetical protein ABT147_24885 [Streptomyces sp. NPDC001868]|uniref:hypothetical protein n=1 Tax=Streptomyces sp. NPDC001868 TaxID=3154401 RepID=UPI00331FB9C5